MKKFHWFICGVVVGALVFGGTLSFASMGQKNAQLTYSDIKIVVEGSLLEPDKEPFIMDSTVYLPLRTIADALGEKVGWENKTVLIGSGSPSLLLTDLISPSTSGLETGDALIKVNNNERRGFYATGQKMRSNASMRFFVQNKGIKEIQGSLALDDSNPDNIKPADIEILVDSKKVWEVTLTKGDKPVPINIKLDNSTSSVTFRLDNLSETKIDFLDFIAIY